MDTRSDNSPRRLTSELGKSDRSRDLMQWTAEATFDLERVLGLLRRRAWIVVASTAIGGALAIFAAFLLLPNYTAEALLSMSKTEFAGSDRGNDAFVDTQLAMLQSHAFLKRAFAFISHDVLLKAAVPSVTDLERRLTVMQSLRSRIISVAFRARSPEVAADVANVIVRLYADAPVLQDAEGVDDVSARLAQQIATLEEELQTLDEIEPPRPNDAASPPERVIRLREQINALRVDQDLARRREEGEQQAQATSPPVQIASLAIPPERPSSPRPVLLVVPATIASMIFGAALAILLGRLDKRIYVASDLRAAFAWPCIGATPKRRWSGVFAAWAATSPNCAGYVRAIDAVVTTILLAPQSEPRSVVITSSVADDGKSEFALNLASAAARMGRRILLMDFDVAGPGPRRLWLRWRDAPRQLGTFDVLANLCPADAAITRLPDSSVDWLPRGGGPFVDPLALIANGRLAKLIDQLGQSYDWIILNSLPAIGVSETRFIASIADDVLLVVNSGVTTFPNVGDALETLSTSISSARAMDSAPNIATVLIDAPQGSLPTTFRDKTASSHAAFPVRPLGARKARPTRKTKSSGQGNPAGADASDIQSVPHCEPPT